MVQETHHVKALEAESFSRFAEDETIMIHSLRVETFKGDSFLLDYEYGKDIKIGDEIKLNKEIENENNKS